MVSPLYALRDEVAQVFYPPFIDRNDESARRSFADAVSSGKVPHARDYGLYRVGTYDDHVGHIVPAEPVTLIIYGSDVEVSNVK